MALFAPHVAKIRSRAAFDEKFYSKYSNGEARKSDSNGNADGNRRRSVMFAGDSDHNTANLASDNDDHDKDNDDDAGSDFASSEESDLFDNDKDYHFTGDSEETAILKAEAALEIDKMTADVINQQMKSKQKQKTSVFENLEQRHLSVRHGQMAVSAEGRGEGIHHEDLDLSDRTSADGIFIGTRAPSPTSAEAKFGPGKIPFMSERRRGDSPPHARPGSPLRLAVVRDVHTVISELKQSEINQLSYISMNNDADDKS